jgi:alpha-1,6-mannosyltransferase
LVYAGRLDREKRPDLLLEAFAGLPQDFPAHLVMAGEGPLRPQLEQQASQIGRVHILPDLSDRDRLAAL